MSPIQSPMTPAPLSPDIYSESIEQQFAIIHDFLLTPVGGGTTGQRPLGAPTAGDTVRTGAARCQSRVPVQALLHHHPDYPGNLRGQSNLARVHLHRRELPVPDGFVWLQEPICLYEGPRFSRRVLLHAFQWYLNNQVEDGQGRIPIMLDGYLVDPDRAKGVPTFHVTINLGWTLDDHYGEQANEAEPVSKHEGSPGHAELSVVMGPVFVRFVASCLSFMEQRITIPVSRPVSRATRRRLQRKQTTFQPSAEVQVVELRRRERPHQEQSDQDDRDSPEWHVQWLVAGHWRRHWYPREKAHKPRYIAPYVKGPQDKPLKPPASQLFVVKR